MDSWHGRRLPSSTPKKSRAGARWSLGALALACLLALAFGCSKASPSREIVIAAAASMRVALPAISDAYAAKSTGRIHVTATYGASGDLQRQVEAGAPVDAVIFASAAPVDVLVHKGRVDAASVHVVARNELVLIGPKDGPRLTFATLAAAPANERIAVGDPGSVPAGVYARAALQKLGEWDAIQPRLVLAADVSAVLAYVRRGEVVAGVVYRTEARAAPDVTVLDVATGPWAPRPEVVAGVVKDAVGGADARAFIAYLAEPEAQAILRGDGFGAP